MNKVKEIFLYIYALKYHILVFVFSFLVFFNVFFPDEAAVKFILKTVYTQTQVKIDPLEPKLSLFPTVGIGFISADVTLSDKLTKIKLGETTFGISFLSLITMSPKMVLSSNSFGGEINGSVLNIPLSSNSDVVEVDIDVSLQSIKTKEVLALFKKPLDIAGILDGSIQGRLNLINFAYSNIEFDFSIKDASLNKIEVVGIPIPDFRVSKALFKGMFFKSDLNIRTFKLGSASEQIDLDSSGKIKFLYQRPYEFKIKLKLAGELEKQFGAFLNIGPLAQMKAENGYLNFKASGDAASPIPQLTPL